MQCIQFERILEDQEGDRLPKPALAHIEVCETCRTLAEDFITIHDVALELGAEGIAPAEHVWISLRNQLEAEGIIHEPRPVTQSVSVGWWTVFQRPALAGSFLALLLVGASMITYQWSSPQMAVSSQMALGREAPPVPSPESVFKEEMLTVGNDAIPGLQKQDAAVTDSIRRNLSVVDNLIAICEKSVREEPDNQMAREYLYGAYQQKAELLATAMNHSVTGGLQ